MQSQSLDGGFDDPARDAAFAFRHALDAMARPGRIETVAGAMPPAPVSTAAGVLLLTLCDATTGLYLAPTHDTGDVRDWVTFHTGAPFVAAEDADFALGTWDALAPVSRFKVGVSEYPDRSATLIVEMGELEARGVVLRGPGIETQSALNLPETAAFVANRRQFPLGFDCYFCAGDRLAGLPRSTIVEG